MQDVTVKHDPTKILEQFPKILYVGDRPAEAPPGWYVFVASRPLIGTWREDAPELEGYENVKMFVWEGEWAQGRHYAAISPTDYSLVARLKDNLALDGRLIDWISVEEYKKNLVAWAKEKIASSLATRKREIKVSQYSYAQWDEMRRGQRDGTRVFGDLLSADEYPPEE